MEARVEGTIEIVEAGDVDDVPSPREILKELVPNPRPRMVPIPKGVIVPPMEGIVATDVATDADTG